MTARAEIARRARELRMWIWDEARSSDLEQEAIEKVLVADRRAELRKGDG